MAVTGTSDPSSNTRISGARWSMCRRDSTQRATEAGRFRVVMPTVSRGVALFMKLSFVFQEACLFRLKAEATKRIGISSAFRRKNKPPSGGRALRPLPT